jgi:lysophospholipase L1-like esterase
MRWIFGSARKRPATFVQIAYDRVMTVSLARRFDCYVALGDSSTEGLDDLDERGGYRGWSRRLAQRIADAQGSLAYANFGVRGLTTRQILDRQLAPALELGPDLATVFSGTNDVIARRFDAATVARDMEAMQRALIERGATVLTFTLPDLSPVMPLARLFTHRIRALNEGLRAASHRTGTIVLDFAAHPVGSDPRIWSADRIHANSAGHQRVADALAHALELPGTDDSWGDPLPELPAKSAREWLAAELTWTRRHLLPWIVRSLRPRSPGRPTRGRSPVLERIDSTKR